MNLDFKHIPEQTHTNEELYNKQVEVLKAFLERGAISREQFDKSYTDLSVKMGYFAMQEGETPALSKDL